LPTDLKVESMNVEDVYLTNAKSNIEEKIRKRGKVDNFSYTHSMTVYDYDFVNANAYRNDGIETKKKITAREYLFLLER